MSDQSSQAAVLFADVSGSTKLYETAGNAVAHAAVETCVNLMKEKTLAAKGRVIKTIGDEVMSAFSTADGAADAAIEMQQAISELPPVGKTTLGIRIGFNFGPVVNRDGAVCGWRMPDRAKRHAAILRPQPSVGGGGEVDLEAVRPDLRRAHIPGRLNPGGKPMPCWIACISRFAA